MGRPLRILFTNWVDAHNFNAQSLNAREIALRLDPARFAVTLFYEREADARLAGRANVTLRRMWRRGGSAQLLAAELGGHDIHFRANLMPATYWYLRLPERARRGQVVDYVEGWIKPQFGDLTARQQAYFHFIQRRIRHRVSISEYVARTSWEDYGLASEAVIPVGADTTFFAPRGARGGGTPRVLFVGTLIERKGAQLVLEAARKFPHVPFRLVGAERGMFAGELHRRAREWNLENVTFEGAMPQAQLRERMAEADILLHPSRVEGIPKVTLEGAAAGLPAIVFDLYETPSVVDGVTGYQVGTFDEMVEKLGTLIEDRAQRERMGAAAVEHARGFDWEVIAARWETYFERIAG